MKVSTPVSLNITLVRLGYNWILLWSVKIKLRLACLCWPRKKQNTVLEYSSLHFIPGLQSLFNTDLQFTFYYMHVWHKINESEEWSSQLIFQFKQLERRSLKKSGLQWDSNPWPPWYSCDDLPTELWWSHTLGARSIYWVHISRGEWIDVKYIRNNSYLNFGCRWKWRMIAVNLKKPEKMQGFDGIRTCDLCDTGAMFYQLSYDEGTHWELGSNPVDDPDFFRLLLANCFNWKVNRDGHSSLSSTTAVQIWIISYILHIISLLTGHMNSLNWPRPHCVASSYMSLSW